MKEGLKEKYKSQKQNKHIKKKRLNEIKHAK